MRSTMVLVSSEPSTNPFSVSVEYLTVLQEVVDSLSDTPSDSGDAAWATAGNAQSTASAKRTVRHERIRTVIATPSATSATVLVHPNRSALHPSMSRD